MSDTNGPTVFLKWKCGKAPFRQRRQRVALGNPESSKPSHSCRTPRIEAAAAISSRRTARSHAVDSALRSGIEDVTTLSASARDHRDLDALGHVARGRGRALAGLVVGVGMHGHEAKRGCHGSSLHHVPSPFTRDQLHPAMRERYGLNGRPVGRRIAVAVVVLGFVGVLIWVTIGVSSDNIQTRLISWGVVGPDRVDITYQVRADATTPIECVLRAQTKTASTSATRRWSCLLRSPTTW